MHGVVFGRDFVRHVRRGGDQVEIEFAAQSFGHDLHVEQTEEAATESEAERHGGFRFVNQRRVVELELVERLTQLRELRVVDREQTRVDHRLRVTIALQRFRRGFLGGGDGVADLGLADVLGSGDHITDLARAQRLRRHHIGADHADLDRFVGHADAHHVQLLARAQLAIDHADVGDDAAIGVVDGVEDQCAGRRVGLARRRGDIGDDAVEQLPHALAGFAGDAQHVGGVAADEPRDLLGVLVGFGAGKIDFVQHGDDGQIMVDGHVEVRQGLRLDALRRIDEKHRSLACGQRAGHLIGEIDVSRRVDHAERVFGAVERPRHADGLRFDGDAAFLLDVHAVEEAIAHFSFRHDAAQLQYAVRHGGFAVIDMCDDAEIADQRLIGETGLVMLLAHAILLVKYVTYSILTASIGSARRDTLRRIGDLSARHVIIFVCMSL